MNKHIFFVLLLAVSFIRLSAQPPIAIGQWRTHLPWKNITWITDEGDKIYCAGNVSFYSFDKETSALQKFDKVSGLSDVGVKLVEYFKEKDILLVIYDNTNIDVIKGNTITNISDIKRKIIIGEKTINQVYFFKGLAYLSSSFGIVVLDLEKLEVKDTYVIGLGDDNNVHALTSDGNYFYAATEGGIKKAPVSSINLANFQEWETQTDLPLKAAHQAVTFNNKVYVEAKDTIYEYNGTSWSYYHTDSNWFVQNITSSDEYLLVSERNDSNIYQGRIVMIDKADSLSYYNEDIGTPMRVIEDDQGVFWVADFLYGLKKIQDGHTWGSFAPNGPGSTASRNISIARGEVWVAPGGMDAAFGYLDNSDGIFAFYDESWHNYNQYNRSELFDIKNIQAVVVHPNEPKVYFASFWQGLVEVDNDKINVYDKDNSILTGISGDPGRTPVTGLAIDHEGNLWMTSFGASNEKPILVKKADGTWKSFKPTAKVNGDWVEQVIIDDNDQLWIVIPKTNSQGILVFNHGPDIDNENDGDSYKILSSGEGNGNLPTNEVICLAKDLEGDIWVGTSQGIAVFYCPSSIFSSEGCEAQRILVTQDGFVGYLLENERINAIAVDGGNRKWIGTENGLFVLSADGTKQLAYFDEQDSPLLSNGITAIAIDGQSGEVFIGTDKGIISYRGEATEGGETHENVLVFPNPIAPDYSGPIAIKGLVNNAKVKITDVSGMLIYQTIAYGGQAIWDGKNYNGTRAKTGVYLVFTTNEDGSSKNVAKLLIIN